MKNKSKFKQKTKTEKLSPPWTCQLCNGKNKHLLYSEKRLPPKTITSKEVLCTGELGARGRHGKIWMCNKCKLIYQDLSFSKIELEKAYAKGTDQKYFEQLRERTRLFRNSVELIERYRKLPGKLLDIGANAGIFLNTAKESGWQVEGLEPSKWACKEAKKRFGIKINSGYFEKNKYRSNSFDVITMWDVLEHYLNPLEQLVRARKLLKKNGILALSTINIDSWFSKLLRSHWTWMIRVHLWYFTSKTLVRMVKKAGYKVEWIGTQTRWFSLPYLLSRFTGKSFPFLPNISIPAPTNDIIVIIARKI